MTGESHRASSRTKQPIAIFQTNSNLSISLGNHCQLRLQNETISMNLSISIDILSENLPSIDNLWYLCAIIELITCESHHTINHNKTVILKCLTNYEYGSSKQNH